MSLVIPLAKQLGSVVGHPTVLEGGLALMTPFFSSNIWVISVPAYPPLQEPMMSLV